VTTTTGTDAPASAKPERPAAPGPSPSDRRRAAADASRRLSRLWLLTPVVIIAVVVGAWAIWHRLTAPALAGDVRLHEVQRRSFPIVLKEKGELKAHKSVDIKCEVEGRSTIIWLIAEGTTVKTGDLLVRLASDTIEERIRTKKVTVNTAESTFETARDTMNIQLKKNDADIFKAGIQLALAEIDLEKWELGDQVQELKDAELALKSAESRLKQAKEQHGVSKRMYEQNFVTFVELEQDRLDEQEADFAFKKAELAQKVLQGYTIRKDRMTYESAVRDAEENLDRTKATAKVEENKAKNTAQRAQEKLELVRADLKKYEDLLEKTQICAPQPGLVVYYSDQHRRSSTVIDVGGTVHQNQTILQLPDLSQMKLVIRIHEADAERIKVGLPAKIQVAGVYEEVTDDAGNGSRASGAQKMFDGQVTKVAALADTRNRWLNPELREFATEIMLNETSNALKPGVTAQSEIYVDHIEDVLAIPVQAVYARGGHSYVFLGDGGRPEYREVQLGSSSTSFVQVLEGISEGDRVWTTISDEMIALLPSVDKEELAAQRELDAARQALPEGRPAGAAAGAPSGGRSGPRSGNRSEARPGGRPGAQPGQRPGDRPGARSGERPGAQSGDRSGARSGNRPGAQSGDRQRQAPRGQGQGPGAGQPKPNRQNQPRPASAPAGS